jgi:hypothetical protein
MVTKETAVTCVIGIVATVSVFGSGYLYGSRTISQPVHDSSTSQSPDTVILVEVDNEDTEPKKD